jgi:hypothetical protein
VLGAVVGDQDGGARRVGHGWSVTAEAAATVAQVWLRRPPSAR